MDPVTAVGASANVLQLIAVAGKAIKYLKDIKNAPQEHLRLVQEINSLYGLLIELESRIDEANASEDGKWLRGIQSLAVKSGPVEQLRAALESIVDRVKPATKMKRIGKTLMWPYTKKEVEEILKEVERRKSTIDFALQGDQLNLARNIKADTVYIPDLIAGFQDIQTGMTHLQNSQDGKAIQKVVDWLSPLNFGDQHNDVLSRRCEGTEGWFIATLEASEWLSSPHKASLWCSGIPGAGKTTIAAITTDHIERTFVHDQSVTVACVYCNYKDKMTQTPANLLASIWMQIRQKSGLSPQVEELYARSVTKGSTTRPRLDEIIKVLRAEVDQRAVVYVIIDALDECETAYRLRLLSELKALQPKLKLMVTSRYFDAFGADLGVDTDVEILASDDNIKRYVRERVLTTPRLQRWVAADSSLNTTIEAKVIEAAQNMYVGCGL